MNEAIRLVLLCTKEGDIVGIESRESDELLMPPQQIPELIMKSLIRLNILKTLEETLGKVVYSFTEFKKIKEIAVVLGGYVHDPFLQDCVLLLLFEKASDHCKIIEDQLFPFLKETK